MQVMLGRRAAKLSTEAWRGREANVTREDISNGGYVHDVYERLAVGTFEQALERLFLYDIFPPARMRTCVCAPNGIVALGAVIVQRTFVGPVALETAVRVIEHDRSDERGFFAYATTDGHPEKGIASFEVRRAGSEVRFVAEAWSRPGNLVALLGRPVSRYIQTSFTKEAVAYFCGQSGRTG